MSLDGTRLGDAVVTALEGVDGSMTADQIAQLRTAWRAIAGAIVTEITGHAVVNPGSMENAASIPVQVNPGTGSGATTASEPIIGTGTVS